MTEKGKRDARSETRQEFEKRTVFTEIFNLFSLVGFLYGALDENLPFSDGQGPPGRCGGARQVPHHPTLRNGGGIPGTGDGFPIASSFRRGSRVPAGLRHLHDEPDHEAVQPRPRGVVDFAGDHFQVARLPG